MKPAGLRMAVVVMVGGLACAQASASHAWQAESAQADSAQADSTQGRQAGDGDTSGRGQAQAQPIDPPSPTQPKNSRTQPKGGGEQQAKAPSIAKKMSAQGTTIAGMVTFRGDKGEIKRHQLDTRADPKCEASRSLIANEDLLLNKKTKPVSIRNAVVSITAGLGEAVYTPPKKPVYLAQHGCQNRPHVLALMAGQPLTIVNMDHTDQSVHFNSTKNAPLVFTQGFTDLAGGKTVSLVAEDCFSVTSDVHPWILSYVRIFPHPYFAVTDHTGRFELKNVPPGKYTVTVWQESLGTRKRDVIVTADTAEVRLDFTLSP